MKMLIFWLGMLLGLILALAVSDRQAGQPETARLSHDWYVKLYLTGLSEIDADDYEELLVDKFGDEINQGIAFVTKGN